MGVGAMERVGDAVEAAAAEATGRVAAVMVAVARAEVVKVVVEAEEAAREVEGMAEVAAVVAENTPVRHQHTIPCMSSPGCQCALVRRDPSHLVGN